MKTISGKAKNEPLTVHFPLIRIGQGILPGGKNDCMAHPFVLLLTFS